MFYIIDIEKADRSKLVPKITTVTKRGKTFQQKVYINPNKKVDQSHQQSSQNEHLIQQGIKAPRKQLFEVAKQRGIKIPPKWEDIWVNQNEQAELQVTGKDSKDRKVYIYSSEHAAKAAAEKFDRLKDFTKIYSKLMQKIRNDMKTKEEAKLLYVIAKTGLRVGSDKDTKSEVQAFGASTLKPEHIDIKGDTITFDFIGKKGVHINQSYKDKSLISIISGSKDKTGKIFNVSDIQVRSYLKSIDGNFKVKDFRTYVGTETALAQIKKMNKPANEKELKQAITLVSKVVANKLGNTPVVAKQAYIAPEVFDQWRT